jgi:tRNA nucleotidyltransferase/poly(A) polymerase
MYRDFTMNALFYDPLNRSIIDIYGTGVVDTIEQNLRIPADRTKWDEWLKGNPSKLLRYWKFLSRKGRQYKPVDLETRDFMIQEASSRKYDKIVLNCRKTLEIVSRK